MRCLPRQHKKSLPPTCFGESSCRVDSTLVAQPSDCVGPLPDFVAHGALVPRSGSFRMFHSTVLWLELLSKTSLTTVAGHTRAHCTSMWKWRRSGKVEGRSILRDDEELMSHVREGAPAVAEKRTLPDPGSACGFHPKELFGAPLGRLDIRPQQSIQKGMTAGIDLPGSQQLLLFLFLVLQAAPSHGSHDVIVLFLGPLPPEGGCIPKLCNWPAASTMQKVPAFLRQPCAPGVCVNSLVSVGTKDTMTSTPARGKDVQRTQRNVRTLFLSNHWNGYVACRSKMQTALARIGSRTNTDSSFQPPFQQSEHSVFSTVMSLSVP